MQLNNYRCAGVIYRIGEIEYVGKKKDYAKRLLVVEVPTMKSTTQGTELYKFEVMGPEANALDQYELSEWVEIMFRIEGRLWNPPDRPEEEVFFLSLRIVDMSRRDNPFETGDPVVEEENHLSPDLMNELAPKVKDFAADTSGLDPLNPEGYDDLPF